MRFIFQIFINLLLISNISASDWMYDFPRKKCVPSKVRIEDFFEYIEKEDSSCKISENHGLYFIKCKKSEMTYLFFKKLSNCNKWDEKWQEK